MKNNFVTLEDFNGSAVEKAYKVDKIFAKSKKEEIRKSDVAYAFSNGLSDSKGIMFKKQGNEFKKLAQSKFDNLNEKQSALKAEMANLRLTLIEANVKFVDNYEYGYSVPDGYGNAIKEESYSSVNDLQSNNINDTRKKIDRFWNLSWQCVDLKKDIKLLNTLINNIDDKEKYNISANQLAVLEKSEDIDEIFKSHKGGRHAKHKYLEIKDGKYIYDYDKMSVEDHKDAARHHDERSDIIAGSARHKSKPDDEKMITMHEEERDKHSKLAKEKEKDKKMSISELANYVKSNYKEITGQHPKHMYDEQDFDEKIIDLVKKHGHNLDEFTEQYSQGGEDWESYKKDTKNSIKKSEAFDILIDDDFEEKLEKSKGPWKKGKKKKEHMTSDYDKKQAKKDLTKEDKFSDEFGIEIDSQDIHYAEAGLENRKIDYKKVGNVFQFKNKKDKDKAFNAFNNIRGTQSSAGEGKGLIIY